MRVGDGLVDAAARGPGQDYKVPAHVRFLEELPRSPGGKVLKAALNPL